MNRSGSKRWLGCLLATGLMVLGAQGALGLTVYVDWENGNDSNDGLSWINAKKSISKGVRDQYFASEVWVRKGVYRENLPTDQTYLIDLYKYARQIYGGFEGHETDRNQRDTTHPWETVLLAKPYSNGPNKAVVRLAGYSSLSNITISGGDSDFFGGAIDFNFPGTFSSNQPPVSNCILYNNKALIGGGIYFSTDAYYFRQLPLITNSYLLQNTATLQGGGLFFNATASSGASTFCTRTHFVGNRAKSGGGIYFQNNPLQELVLSVFARNEAESSGGAIFMESGNNAFRGCTISENRAKLGGGIYLTGDNTKTTIQSIPSMFGCQFTYNTNYGIYGGGVVSNLTKFSNLPAQMKYCLFNNPDGDVATSYYGDLDVPADLQAIDSSKYSNNLTGGPDYVMYSQDGVAGTFSQVSYDSTTFQSTLLTEQMSFLPNELQGKIIGLGAQNTHYTIVTSNTATSINVLGDQQAFSNGSDFEILDYSLSEQSAAIDRGGPGWVNDLKDIRYVNRDHQGWDIGAYEYAAAPAHLLSVHVENAGRIRATFDIDMAQPTVNNFQVSGNGAGTLPPNPTSISILDGRTFDLIFNSGEMKTGGDITVNVLNLETANGGIVAAPTSLTHVGGGLGISPIFQSFSVFDSNRIDVSFSENVKESTILPTSVSISGSGRGTFSTNPVRIIKQNDKKYRLEWSGGSMITAGDITLTLENTITDLAGNSLSEPLSQTLPGSGIGRRNTSIICQTDTGEIWASPFDGSTLSAPHRIGNLGFLHNAMSGWQTLAADFNGDAWQDLGTVTPWGEFWVAYNNRDGTFNEPEKMVSGVIYAPKQGWINFAQDVNGDSRADLIQVSGPGDVLISWSLENGFTELQIHLSGQFFYNEALEQWVDMGDLNGDGRADLIQYRSTINKMRVAYGSPTTLENPVDFNSINMVFSTLKSVYPVMGDFNGDTLDDILYLKEGHLGEPHILFSKQEGGFYETYWAPPYLYFQTNPHRGNGWMVFAADMNNDGRDDLVQLTEYSSVWIAYSTGSGFQTPVLAGFTGFQSQPHGPYQTFIGRFVEQ